MATMFTSSGIGDHGLEARPATCATGLTVSRTDRSHFVILSSVVPTRIRSLLEQIRYVRIDQHDRPIDLRSRGRFNVGTTRIANSNRSQGVFYEALDA